LRVGKKEKWQHTFLKKIFCRFSDAARLQKGRLQAAKVLGIGSKKTEILYIIGRMFFAHYFTSQP